MTDAASKRIEDLELSVRSSALLMELGVETVADLLALPSISAPPVVVAELTEVLAEMDLVYGGDWSVPEAKPAIEATGTITERWDTIETWLEENAPGALATLRRGAPAAEVAAAEQALGVSLPEDYKELVARHDGQRDLGPMVGFCTLLPVGELRKNREWLEGLMAESAFDAARTDAGIQPVAWHGGWIPIGHFQRDYMVLDLAPAPGGTRGQIFLCYVDDDRRAIVAKSCAELLSRFFRELQDGTIDLDEYLEA